MKAALRLAQYNIYQTHTFKLWNVRICLSCCELIDRGDEFACHGYDLTRLRGINDGVIQSRD